VILGVLLAAGTGSRFDGESESSSYEENKLLAELDGEPLVAHAARTLTESSLDTVIAVVGHDREKIERALPEEIEPVANPDYEQGQSTSVRRGIATARERNAEAVLFALGDMPCVEVETVETLLREYRKADDPDDRPVIVAPRFDGQRGNPVLFDSQFFDALASVEGDTGGRALLESEPVAWVDVSDPGVHRDVDTESDIRKLRDE
jgi:molybdenum cofactor cytidylyltransferase